MPLRVTNLRLGLDEPESALPEHISRLLGVMPADLGPWRILRKSLDARNRDALEFVYTAEVCPAEMEDHLLKTARRRRGPIRIVRYVESSFRLPRPGDRPLERQVSLPSEKVPAPPSPNR